MLCNESPPNWACSLQNNKRWYRLLNRCGRTLVFYANLQLKGLAPNSYCEVSKHRFLLFTLEVTDYFGFKLPGLFSYTNNHLPAVFLRKIYYYVSHSAFRFKKMLITSHSWGGKKVWINEKLLDLPEYAILGAESITETKDLHQTTLGGCPLMKPALQTSSKFDYQSSYVVSQ